MNRRNRIEISVKGLILAVVVIIALILSAISLYMVTKSKSTINDGNTQYSQLMSSYSEINATLYDGLYVTGDKVTDVIESEASSLVKVVVITKGGDANGSEYTTSDGYSSLNLAKTADEYINPAGTFVGKVHKNDNGMVDTITFTQQ